MRLTVFLLPFHRLSLGYEYWVEIEFQGWRKIKEDGNRWRDNFNFFIPYDDDGDVM